MRWLLWLLVLPIASVAAFVVDFLLLPFIQHPEYYDFVPDPRSAAILAKALLLPLIYIGVSSWLAPNSKFRVAVVIAILLIFFYARGYWTTLPLIQLSPSDFLVQAIAMNAVGVVAGLFLVRRLARSKVQTPA
jgi:hypothetical protein